MFGQTEEDHFLYQVLTSGRHFLSFWGPINSESRGNRDCGAKNNQANPNKLKDYLIDVYDRSTNQKGRFLTCASHLNTKPSFSKITDRFDRSDKTMKNNRLIRTQNCFPVRLIGLKIYNLTAIIN